MRFIVYFFLVGLFLPVFLANTAHAATSAVIISQVRTDGGNAVGKPPKEYVELFNTGTAAVNLAGWRLEYANPKATLTAKTCMAASWVAAGGKANVKETTLAGQIPAHGTVLIANPGMLDDQSGSVRLVQPGKTSAAALVVHDMVGWDSGVAPAVCAETKQAIIPGNAQRLSRCVDGAKGYPQDSDNNSKDFFIRTDAEVKPLICKVAAPGGGVPPSSKPLCEDIQVSEIFANPTGDDRGKEYIEIYNPATKPQSLKGCTLRTGYSTKQYSLPETMTLKPGEQKALYSKESGLHLNNKGSEVWLITPTEENILKYPELGDDQAWALIGKAWKLTDSATPDKANVLGQAGRGGGDIEVSPGLGPCPSGKYRNPATNRCKMRVVATASYVSCHPGQTRNPLTNRCRNTVIASAALVPCEAGQQRNPATNRCRSVLAAAIILKPCGSGQQRNPETNRCRKVAGLASTAATESRIEPTRQGISSLSYLMLGALSVGAIGYGAYEYRHDLRNKFASVRARVARKSGK